jgi:hypothetical protein
LLLGLRCFLRVLNPFFLMKLEVSLASDLPWKKLFVHAISWITEVDLVFRKFFPLKTPEYRISWSFSLVGFLFLRVALTS